ncbi:4-hydroxy-3-methylbut-2-enyl diphosphate reductase [Pseudothermotoga sp.]|nr:4-hydroxy-3-methylbut-2-enyl diphosphate reductase [Pseudothermotoga sp.]MCX7813518.1 4-hydroxy-3-methylbut-2-enyl diphosphate reductase [Pseudothermotoga sp.]MDW8140561.1 4-hydroxy-3-methylbut-2-enyl diphosphate reductase [Pseudothermotoga sp.]
MKLCVAENIGFCFGVERALEIVQECLKTERSVYTLGEIVHNKNVVERLKRQGLKIFRENEPVPKDAKDSVLIVRAHGVAPKVLNELEKNFKRVIDATCPIVLKLFDKAKRAKEESYVVVVFGDENHDEMKALKGYVEDAIVTETAIPLKDRVCVLSQTTMSLEDFLDFGAELLKSSEPREFLLLNTVCEITHKREIEVRNMARECDLIVVVGGKNSSNTKKLAKIASKMTKVLHVESASEIIDIDFKNFKKIGVTAGTSTPLEDVKTVVEKIQLGGRLYEGEHEYE